MSITRRKFVGMAAVATGSLLVGCNGGDGTSLPAAPAPTPTAPPPNPIPPGPTTGPNYLYSGTVYHQMTIKEAIAHLNPIYSPGDNNKWLNRYGEEMVVGFQIKERPELKDLPNLVFFVNDEQFDNLGVAKKILQPGQHWACKPI